MGPLYDTVLPSPPRRAFSPAGKPAARRRPRMPVELGVWHGGGPGAATAPPTRRDAVPADAVVREGSGAMVVFTTTDQRHFTRRPVQLGPLQDGYYPVLDGLPPRQRIASEGALFLSNALALQAQ